MVSGKTISEVSEIMIGYKIMISDPIPRSIFNVRYLDGTSMISNRDM